jgi:hypothetical protein
MLYGQKIRCCINLMSFILWIFILGAPWLPMSTTLKASIVAILIVLGEIFFWGGTVLVGKDIVKKYMHCINPMRWVRKWKL